MTATPAGPLTLELSLINHQNFLQHLRVAGRIPVVHEEQRRHAANGLTHAVAVAVIFDDDLSAVAIDQPIFEVVNALSR